MATTELYNRFTIDRLTKQSVSIIKETFIDLNGVETKVGDIWRCAFEDTPEQRDNMKNLLGKNSIEYSIITQLWDA